MRPLPSKNGPGGPCDPLPDTKKRKKNPETLRPGANWSRSTAPPGPHSGAGRVRRPGGMPRTKTGPPLLVGVKKAANTQQKGKTKQQKETTKNTLAASRPEKGPQKSTRRIPKTRGAQNGTPRKHQEAGRTAKKGEQTSAAGQQKEQGKKHKVRLGVCPVTT